MSDQDALAIKVLSKTVITPTLFSFRTERPTSFRFEAGQFVRIGINPSKLLHGGGGNDEKIFRAYSVVSSPYDDFLEFFSVVVPSGAFTSHLQHLQIGDTLYLNPQAFGYLTQSRYQEPAPCDLWLLATGTGVAPFLSMLQDPATWEKYHQIVLAYSVRHASELAYKDLIENLQLNFGGLVDIPATFTFVPIVTRQEQVDMLHDRMPLLIQNGELERVAKLNFDPTRCHVMLCGNPQMVDDTKEALKARGLTMNRRGVGNIAVENYW